MTKSGQRRWRIFFRVLFSTGAGFRFIRKRRPMPPIEELVVVGRRSGLTRSLLVQLIETPEGGVYVIEPSGFKSNWVDNLTAAGLAKVNYWGGRSTTVRAVELPSGAERDAAVAAMPNNQPPPLRFIYRRALGHIRAVGRVFRLDPV
jgi:deazaflavin-dependent oxidoreductase (nitroreductase family)